MIRSLRANQNTFKAVEFKDGFNVILADRTKSSTKKDSRNGLGKSTLIELIHFCLGSKPVSGEGIRNKALSGWIFSLEIDLDKKTYIVSRSVDEPGRIIIEGNTQSWPLDLRVDEKTNKKFLLANEWTEILGWLMFDIPIGRGPLKYAPSFRSLISYFIRSGRDAFSNPFEHYRKQLEWDIQVHNSFLLGLDWEKAQEWQILKDKEKNLTQIRSAVGSGVLPSLFGTVGELQAQKIRLDEKAADEKRQLDEFKVHPQYKEIEHKANTLTAQIHEASNQNISRKQLLGYYNNSLAEEKPATEYSIEELYKEAGVVFPDSIVKHIDEVKEFQKQVVENRRDFLTAEMRRLTDEIDGAERLIKTLSDNRAELMMVLQSHGALEEYTWLQQMHSKTISELEETKARIENLRLIEQGRSQIKIEKEKLLLRARLSFEENEISRQNAISLFNSNSESLYNASGRLIIDISSTGYKFNVDIDRSSSQGIEQMKVFCYDLMLSQLWSKKKRSPGFLIHDSTIFDGVDERQIASALQIAHSEVRKKGFQYICCLNSDLIPWDEFESDFNIKNEVILTLTDESDTGGLLGLRF